MRALQQVDAVIHTASLHKQHIVTHCEQKFIDTNITGTYTLLEAAETRGVTQFVMSSTTKRVWRCFDAICRGMRRLDR